MASATAAYVSGISSSKPQSIVIEENSLLMKVISYIPLIGIIPAFIQEVSLANKIFNTSATEVPRVIELINIKNQYKIASAVRNLLTAALIVAGTAFGILGGALVSSAVPTVTLIGLAGLHIYKMSQNNKLITELQSTGFRRGMRPA